MAFLDETGLAELWALIKAEDDAVQENGVKIAYGSYTGTGTSKSGNENSLTFSFVPKVVVIGKGGYYGDFSWVRGQANGKSYVDSSQVQSVILTWSGNTISWYGSSAAIQLNESGSTYYYVAIG